MKRVGGIILVAVTFLFTSAALYGLDWKDLTFFAPFDGSLQPAVARGDPNPLTGAKKPMFTEGVIGKALIAGDPGVLPSYAVKGNINYRQGSLALWLKPLNWSAGDAQQHIYMRIPGRWLFYHYWEGGTTCFYWMRGSRILWGVSGYISPRTGQWNHYAITWDSGKCTIYHNGKYYAHRNDMPDNILPWDQPETNRFSIADNAWTKGGNNRTAFDELMIFNRPLSDVEIMSIYRRGSRSLPAPAVRIPRQKVPPAIDGRVQDWEWNRAAGVTGFLDRPFGNLTRRGVRARFSYDDKNLYILIEADKSPSKTGGFVEVWLAADENAPEEGIYHFKFTADGVKSLLVGRDIPRQGRWMAASGMFHGREVTEIAIPFATISVDPASAKNLRINIIKSWSAGYGDWASWADVTLVSEADLRPGSFGLVELGGEEPVLNIRSLGRVDYARLDLDAEILNPKEASENIRMTIRLQPTDLREYEDEQFIKRWTGTVVSADRTFKAEKGSTAVHITLERKIALPAAGAVCLYAADSYRGKDLSKT